MGKKSYEDGADFGVRLRTFLHEFTLPPPPRDAANRAEELRSPRCLSGETLPLGSLKTQGRGAGAGIWAFACDSSRKCAEGK